MFFPIQDDNPLRKIPFQYVTIALIAANVLVYLLEITRAGDALIASFGLMPADLFNVRIIGGAVRRASEVVAFPEAGTLVSYMFLHGDPWHLAGNMLFLWVFGDNVEDALGHARFLAFYLLSGIAAGLAHAVMAPNSTIPLVGASGAVAGIIAAYLMLYPRVNVWVMVLRVIPLQVSAALALGAWIVSQFAMVVAQQVGLVVGPVAWWAHIGGLVAGALLVLVLRRRDVPLFQGWQG